MTKKAKVLIAAILGAIGITAIKKLVLGLLLPLFMLLIAVGSNSSLSPKIEVSDTARQNSGIINAAAYVIYEGNISGVYDARKDLPPEEIIGLGKYYIHIDEGIDMSTGSLEGRWEPLNDRNVIAVMDLDGVQKITKEKNIIKIDFGSRGIAPSGMSRGMYFLPNDTIYDIETIYKGPFDAENNGFISHSGGNTLYTERICKNLWYYEETW